LWEDFRWSTRRCGEYGPAEGESLRALGRVTIATLAAGAMVSTVGVGGALAFQPVSFTYDVTNLARGTHFQAVYSGGADQGLGGSAQAGTIDARRFAAAGVIYGFRRAA
jgi:hypothetical protein